MNRLPRPVGVIKRRESMSAMAAAFAGSGHVGPVPYIAPVTGKLRQAAPAWLYRMTRHGIFGDRSGAADVPAGSVEGLSPAFGL
jgi:hypothetical protein